MSEAPLLSVGEKRLEGDMGVDQGGGSHKPHKFQRPMEGPRSILSRRGKLSDIQKEDLETIREVA